MPAISMPLDEALDAYVNGDYVYFMMPNNKVVKYNITYNMFEEAVKFSECKFHLSVINHSHQVLQEWKYLKTSFSIGGSILKVTSISLCKTNC